MAPALQPGKNGQPPAFLPPMAGRPIDVTFSGWAWCLVPFVILQCVLRIPAVVFYLC